MGIFSSTEKRIDDVTKRLASTNQELDALDQQAPPTSDLAVEEENALRRLTRKEALGRVKVALSSELAQLQQQLATEKEAERKAKEAKLQADIEKQKAKVAELLWPVYEATQAYKDLERELDKVAPNFHPRQNAESYSSKLSKILQDLGAAKIVFNGVTLERTVTRISN